MEDHDQRLKVLLREFFREFFETFFKEWAARFDFDGLEFLDKELFLEPPTGERRQLDLVAKLRTREPVPGMPGADSRKLIALIHIEVESARSVADFRRRMYEYYEHLRRHHQMPVLPVVLFLNAGLEGLRSDTYEERFWELPTLRFEYLCVGLPAMTGTEFLDGRSALGAALAALMKLPAESKALLRAKAADIVLKLTDPDPERQTRRRVMLFEFIEAYWKLDDDQLREYEELTRTEEFKGVRQMAATTFEKGIDVGERKILRSLLEKRFGPLTPAARGKLESWPADRLEELGERLLTARSLKELGFED